MDGLVSALATSAPTAFGNLIPWGDPSWYRCVCAFQVPPQRRARTRMEVPCQRSTTLNNHLVSEACVGSPEPSVSPLSHLTHPVSTVAQGLCVAFHNFLPRRLAQEDATVH